MRRAGPDLRVEKNNRSGRSSSLRVTSIFLAYPPGTAQNAGFQLGKER